jgi:hypothetical protein
MLYATTLKVEHQLLDKIRGQRRWREMSTQHRNWRTCCDSLSSNLAAQSQLAVDIVSMKETDHTETRRYGKVIVRSMACSRKHDGTTINVPNFAKTHFDVVDGELGSEISAKHLLHPFAQLCHNISIVGCAIWCSSALVFIALLVQRTDCLRQLTVTADCDSKLYQAVSLSWCTIAGKTLQQALVFGAEDVQKKLDIFVVNHERMSEAVHALSMYFYTSNAPPGRASNLHLQKSFALLGAVVPKPRDVRGSLLDAATSKVTQSTHTRWTAPAMPSSLAGGASAQQHAAHH